jgi:DNA-binding protein HU-beta
MNKGELIEEIAKNCEISKKSANEAVNSLTEAIAVSLKKGDKVSIMGFGSFEVRARAARTGRNPQTGKTIKIKAKKVPKFNAGSELKDAVAKAKK